jgi:hypothetical protein
LFSNICDVIYLRYTFCYKKSYSFGGIWILIVPSSPYAKSLIPRLTLPGGDTLKNCYDERYSGRSLSNWEQVLKGHIVGHWFLSLLFFHAVALRWVVGFTMCSCHNVSLHTQSNSVHWSWTEMSKVLRQNKPFFLCKLIISSIYYKDKNLTWLPTSSPDRQPKVNILLGQAYIHHYSCFQTYIFSFITYFLNIKY